MASSASSDVSPTAALFHSLWLVEPNPRRRRNASADGFIEITQCKSDRPRDRGITRSWSMTAECGCEHEDCDYEDCEEVYNMLYVPLEPSSPPPPPPVRRIPAKEFMSQSYRPPLACADPYSLLSDEEWRQAGRLPPFSFSLSWFSYLLSDIAKVCQDLFYFLIPTAWLYAEWIRFTCPAGTPRPGERGTVYVALPEPGKKGETEYRIPFVSLRIIEEMVQQAALSSEDGLCVYNVPSQYEHEVFRACDRFNLTAASVRSPAGVYDCIWVVRDGKIVRDLGARSDYFIVAGKDSKLVDKVAAQTNRRSAALNRHYDYLLSLRTKLITELSENLAFLMPAKRKEEKPRELSREELLGDESALASLPLLPLPSPPRPHRQPEEEHPLAQAISEVCQEEFLANNEFEMGMEYIEDEYIPYVQLY